MAASSVPQAYAPMIANLEVLRDTFKVLGAKRFASDLGTVINALQGAESLPPPDQEAWKNLFAALQQEEKLLEILVQEMKRIATFELSKKQQAFAHLLVPLSAAYNKNLDLAAEGKKLKELCTKMIMPFLRDLISVLQPYPDMDKPRNDLAQLHQATMEALAMVMDDMNGILGKDHMQSLAAVFRHLQAQQKGIDHLTQSGSLIAQAIQQDFIPTFAKAAEAVQEIHESIERNDRASFGKALAKAGSTTQPAIVDGLHQVELAVQQEYQDLESYHDQLEKDHDVVEKINKAWASIQKTRG